MSILTQIIVVVGIIFNEQNKVLIAQRTSNQTFSGYWEFPGGKVEGNESLETALVRELREEVKLTPLLMIPLQTIEYQHHNKRIQLNFFQIDRFEGQAYGAEQQEIRWVPISDLTNYQFPEANQSIVELLLKQYS